MDDKDDQPTDDELRLLKKTLVQEFSSKMIKDFANKIIEEFEKELKENDQFAEDCYDVGYDEGTMNRAVKKMIKMHNQDIGREKHNLLEELDVLGPEFLTLRSDLGSSISDPERAEVIPLFELRDCLMEKNRILGKQRDERLAQYEALKKQEDIISKSFGSESRGLSYNMAPSLEQLQDYKIFLDAQKADMVKRQGIVEETKSMLTNLMNDLERTCQNEIQNKLFFGQFMLDDKNMEELQKFKREVEDEAKACKRKLAKLKDTVSTLWNFLELDRDQQDSFLANFDGKSIVAIITMLEKEITRCKNIKLSNIEKYIFSIREEISKYWNLLFYSDEQKQAFEYFKSDNFTEELLDVHEEELNILKEKHSYGHEIYAAFKERMELWEKMKEMENKANDPDRYNNRGGKLLVEGKERAKLTSLLPKVEKKLMIMVENWESKTGRRFSVYGESLPTFINEQWERRKEDKENEKLDRRAKNEQKMDEMLNGIDSAKRTASCKRPREACGTTPLRPGTSKMLKTNILTPTNSKTNVRIVSSGVKLIPTSTGKGIATPAKGAELPPSRKLFSKITAKGKRNVDKKSNGNRKAKVDETKPFGNSIETTNAEFQKNVRIRYRRNKHIHSSAVPSPSPVKTPSKQGNYQSKLGIPFLM